MLKTKDLSIVFLILKYNSVLTKSSSTKEVFKKSTLEVKDKRGDSAPFEMKSEAFALIYARLVVTTGCILKLFACSKSKSLLHEEKQLTKKVIKIIILKKVNLIIVDFNNGAAVSYNITNTKVLQKT